MQPTWLKQIAPTAEAIMRLLYPYAEVVLHDLKTYKIIAIYNCISKREVGEEVLLSPEQLKNIDAFHGPYEKANWNGKPLKCVSSLVFAEDGKTPLGLITINMEVELFEIFASKLMAFIHPETLSEKPEALFDVDWQVRINQYVRQYLLEQHLSIENLNRQQKVELINHLNDIGAFNAKNAAQYIANILGVSRATVYNNLKGAKA